MNKKKSIKLFKYCQLPDCHNWESLIERIKFSRISRLNDPFEGFLKIRDEDGKVNQRISRDTFIASFSRVPPNVPVDDNSTKLHKNLYMWSHYCDSLNGICLEYEYTSTNKKNFKSGDVKYIQDFPNKVNVFQKYKSWEFENEYRFIYSCKDKNRVDYYNCLEDYSLKIKAIYLGVRLLGKDGGHGNGTDIRNLMSKHPFAIFMNKRFPKIKLYVCVRHTKSFKIIKLKKALTFEN